jgi:hypothetical protein
VQGRLVFEVEAAWDGATLLVSLVGTVYLVRLRNVFKGGTMAGGFNYFLAAAGVTLVGFGLKLVLDVASITPEDYFVSVRDLVILAVLALVVMGIREASGFWTQRR